MSAFILRMYFKLYTTLLLIFPNWLQVTNAAHILALFVNGHRSHLLAYSSVINVLTSRGHNVTIVTTLDVKDIGLSRENIRWLQMSENYTRTRLTSTHNVLDKIENMLNRIEETSKFMDDPQWQSFLQESHQYDLLIVGYLFNDYQLGLAAHYNCPVVVMWTGQPIGFIHSLMGNPEERWYVPQPYDRHQYRGLQAIAFGWFEKFIEFLALNKMEYIYGKHFPNSHYPSFGEIRKSVSLALCHHHSLSEGPIAPLLPGIIEIGGLTNTYNLDNINEFNLTNEIPIQSNIIFFSLGSRVKWTHLPTSLELKFIESFKAFPNYTIIWTYDKNCTELEISSTNIKCKSWWHQSSILASNQTKLFITHGGKGSISEAQRNGIPTLGLPIFGDQISNVANIERRKLGLKLTIDSITVDVIVKTIRELLENHLYRYNVEKFSRLYRDRPVDIEDSVIYWLEYVIRYKGAKHIRSPALELNFVEYYLIDVRLLILLCFSCIIFLCNCLENKLK